MTDRYAVMGHPIEHSRSPAIHAAFARETGQHMAYAAMHVRPGDFPQALHTFQRLGGKGLNVTLPFKGEACVLAEVLTDRARQAQAVNTLWFTDDGRLYGDNTDGAGLVRDLTVNLGCALHGRGILLLGAGGAAGGVIGPLLQQAPKGLTIANRTAAKAVDLAAAFHGMGPVEGVGLDELAGRRFEVIVNATSASLSHELPDLPSGILVPAGWCYDMMYAAQPTVFMRWGESEGAKHAVDGLGMLVEQAAESFSIWRGVHPSTAPVIDEIRRSLQMEASPGR